MKQVINKYVDKYVRDQNKLPKTFVVVLVVAVLVFIGSFSFLLYEIFSFKRETATSTQILFERVTKLESDLATTTLVSNELSAILSAEQIKSASLQDSISDISGTVGNLEKLSKTDKELLQKYSRVYFLSDNYIPMELDLIDSKYLFDATKKIEFHASALNYLYRMLRRAVSDDVDLKIVSGYRSFGTQSALKTGYLTTYGSGANQFSADQGYSEHQLGTAVDLTVGGLTPALSISFENTPAYTWLTKNAYKYGFVLSYPRNNIYYQYEPWHWRFVGVKLATKLHNEGMNFSDMEQREIDTYLIKIFD